MKNNLIAHCKTKHDKIYMVCVRKDQTDWLVMTKWGNYFGGSRPVRFKVQIAYNVYDEATARRLQREVFEAKLRKGYQDIDDPAYTGCVKRSSMEIAGNLEKENDTNQPNAPKENTSQPNAPVESLVAVCMNNTGVEGRFDVGVSYVFEEHDNKHMIWVYDKFGCKMELLQHRFQIQEGQ